VGGIEGAGWRLSFTNEVPEMLKIREGARKFTDFNFSLGFTVKEDGVISDVIPGLPAHAAGVSPGMKLRAVNGRKWTPELLKAALKSAGTKTEPIELLLENEDFFVTCKVDYHRGEKYPVLERDSAKADLLAEILKPSSSDTKNEAK
jgi:predicted metalloprotease with PDZ domain